MIEVNNQKEFFENAKFTDDGALVVNDEGGGGSGGSSGINTPFIISSKDSNILADGAQGQESSDGAEGWTFVNGEDPTQKINWYYINNALRTTTQTLTTLTGGYAIIDIKAAGVCYFNVYTKRKNDGQDYSWYRSRRTYLTYNAFDNYVGQQVVVYWGTNPDIYPTLPRVEMTLDPFTTFGLQEADEEIFLSALNTSSSYPAGTYNFNARTLGYIDNDKNYNLPCTHHTSITGLTNSVNTITSFFNAVKLGRFFRGYVMDETEMLALTNPLNHQYSIRVDTLTIWEYNGTDWYDTAIQASVSGIAQEEEIVLSYSNTHYLELDGVNDFVNIENVDSKVMDFTESFSLGYEVESVSTVNDSSYTTLFKRGENEITLRKGGTNWGIYIYCNGNAIAQANTWYAPQPGSKIFITCDGNRIKYYLDGSQRASMTINANISHNDPVGYLQVGNGGVKGSNWYGGINNLLIMEGAQAVLGSDERTEYFTKQDATTLSFYPSVFDFIPLGERPYPNVLGLKQVVTGTLSNGLESNYFERPTPGAIGVPFTDAPGQYIKLDGTNNYLNFPGVDTDILDFSKQWAVSMKIKNVSGVNDASKTVLFKRGKNEITLVKGGSNWGLYVYCDGLAIGQANTWYAPGFDSDIVFICSGTRLEYYLNGARRAYLTFNGNVSNNDPVGDLQIGNTGIVGGYWYGGLKDSLIIKGANSQLTSTQVNEYRNSTDATTLSYYNNLLDYLPFAADAYPDIIGTKSVVNGELIGGNASDFVNI